MTFFEAITAVLDGKNMTRIGYGPGYITLHNRALRYVFAGKRFGNRTTMPATFTEEDLRATDWVHYVGKTMPQHRERTTDADSNDEQRKG